MARTYRGRLYLSFNDAAGYYCDDGETMAYYFDDAYTMRYDPSDG